MKKTQQIGNLITDNAVISGIVNASGDLITWGTQPDGSDWTIGIVNPTHKHQVFLHINISNIEYA